MGTTPCEHERPCEHSCAHAAEDCPGCSLCSTDYAWPVLTGQVSLFPETPE